jgi:D-3-phosphoglycerate dehydrogenase
VVPEEVDTLLPRCEVILDASMRIPFHSKRLALAECLALVVTATTGSDHIDARYLASRSIPLMTLKGQTELLQNLTPAAEHSWLLLMACARKLTKAVAHVMEGEWDRSQFPGIMLRGKTLGIIGCGRIGGWMAKYAAAFGMHVLGHDPYIDSFPPGVEPVGMDELLAASDFVSLHVHLTNETRGLLGAGEFAKMKPGAVVVNTSRGGLTDEAALLRALESGHLGWAGLDVLDGEPAISSHPLVNYARGGGHVIITPHVGGLSPDALKYVLTFCCGRIAAYLAGQPRGS